MKYRTLAAAAALAIVVTACAASAPTGPGAGTIDHPTDPSQAILTVRYEGGFVPAEYLFTSLPVFALYGDGTLILPGAQIEIYPGPALPPILAQRVSEVGIQAILRAALETGLDRDGDYSDMGNMGVADASTTAFELTIDGTTHRVSAYALGMEGEQQAGQPNDMWAMRQALATFQGQVSAVQDLVPTGSLGEVQTYVSAAAQLLVRPYRPDDQLPQDPIRWPIATRLDSGTPVVMLGEDASCLVVSGDAWTAVRALAEQGNQLTPWRSEGVDYAITFRPLLPDETGCEYGAD